MTALTAAPGSGSVAEAPRPRVILVAWQPWPYESPSLRGHATVDFSGFVIARIPIFRRADGGLSAGVPSVPEIGRDGRQLETNGKRRFSPAITFSGDGKARWEKLVLIALIDGGITP